MAKQDDARSKILARRAAFVAAALAGLSNACDSEAQVCLEPEVDATAPPDDAESNDADAKPNVCLSYQAPDDAEPPDTDADAREQVCLDFPEQ